MCVYLVVDSTALLDIAAADQKAIVSARYGLELLDENRVVAEVRRAHEGCSSSLGHI